MSKKRIKGIVTAFGELDNPREVEVFDVTRLGVDIKDQGEDLIREVVYHYDPALMAELDAINEEFFRVRRRFHQKFDSALAKRGKRITAKSFIQEIVTGKAKGK